MNGIIFIDRMAYLRKSDPQLTNKEGKFLNDLTNNVHGLHEYKAFSNDENFEVLANLTGLNILQKKENSFILTEYGVSLIEDFRFRIEKYPSKDSLCKYIRKLIKEKGVSRKLISTSTGISLSKINNIFSHNRTVLIEDLEGMCECLSVRLSDIIDEVIVSDHCNALGLVYAQKNDLDFTVEEITYLSNLFKNNTKLNKDKQSIRKVLMDKGLIAIKRDERENIIVFLTKDGNEIIKSIEDRKNYPDLKKVSEKINREIKKREWGYDDVAAKTGINKETIIKILKETKALGYYYPKKVVHIDDLVKICKSLYLDFYTVIAELQNKNEKENELKNKSVKKASEENNVKINLQIKNYQKKDIAKKKSKYKLLVSESPIETKLLKELIKLADIYDFSIETQKWFSINTRNHRADIYIEMNGKKFLVECDGHEYHEKTKEQAQRDKQRDRDFMSIGISTLRFTGSEIHRNAKSCAREIFSTYEGYLKNISL